MSIARLGSLLSITLLLAVGCEVVAPTNPFDPDAPPEQQAKGGLHGSVVLSNPTAAPDELALELAAIRVRLLDGDGRPVTGDDGADLTRELNVNGDDRGEFVFDAVLVPGIYTVVVDNVASFYRSPVIVPANVTAGSDVEVVDLVFTFEGENGCGPGSIAGSVDVDAAGQETVSLFVKRGDEVRFVDAQVTSSGAFEFVCLPTGTYAVVAESSGFTPDHRLDINLRAESEGGQLAQTFDGEAALHLFPVSAVMVPLAGEHVRISDGRAFIGGDDAPLAVLAFGGVTHMRFSTSSTFDDAAEFEPFAASKSVALPAREGSIELFAQFEVRSVDFTFTSDVFSTTVVRDVTSPAVLGLALPGTSDDGTAFLADDGALQLVIDAQDAVSAVDGYSVDIDGVGGDAIANVTSAGGRIEVQTPLNLVVDGTHVVTVQLRDKAGNLSSPAVVSVVLDTGAPDVDLVVDNADNGVLHERRAVLAFTDQGGDAETVDVELVRGDGSVETLIETSPFTTQLTVNLPTPNHNERISLRAHVADHVGNSATLDSPSLRLSFVGRVAGAVDVDGVPDVVADSSGVAIDVVDAAGVVVGSAVTDAAGIFVVDDIVETAVATVVARKDGWVDARRGVGAIVAQAPGAPAVDADRIALALATGTIAVNARREEAVNDDTAHAGIVVRARLAGGGRAFEAVEVTGDDGGARFTGLPSTLPGESYSVTATLDRHQPVTTTTTLAAGAVVSLVDLRLGELSGAFDVCPGASGACVFSSFANTDDVRVRLRGVVATAIRVRAGNPILATTSVAELPFEPIGNAGADVADISAQPDGLVAVFVQFQTLDATSDVLTTTITKDTVAPAPPTVRLALADGARVIGFTRFDNVDLVVDGDAGAGNVAPLARARVVVADVAPATAPAVGSCDDATVCTIALPTVSGAVVEKAHGIHAFACDQAGNCSTAASTSVIHDRTPPSVANGASFTVTDTDVGADTIVGGELVLRAPLYVGAIGTGAAKTAGGAAVRFADGTAVADVFAYRVSLLASASDVATRDLAPGAVPAANTARTDLVTPQLQAIDQTQTLFAVLVDAAGNEAAAPIARALRIDTTAPDVGFSLAAPDGNAVATTTNQVRLVVSATGEVPSRVQLDLDNDGAFDDADVAFPFVGGADLQALPLGADGPAVVTARFVDAIGNAAVRSATILVDRGAPDVVSLVCATCRTVNGALFSSAGNAQETFNVVANDGAGSGVEKLSISVNGGAPTLVLSPTTAAVTLSPNSNNTVVVRAIDRAGNTSSLAQARSLTIVHDTQKPTFDVVVAGGAALVKQPDVTVAINNASSDVVGMRLSSTASFSGPDLPFNPATSFTLPFPDALRTVFVELVDAAGNRDVHSDDVRLDTVAPNGALVVATSAGFVRTSSFAVNATLDGATRFALGVEPFVCPTTLPALPTLPLTQGPFADGTLTLVGCFGDDAGNVSQNRLTLTVDSVAAAPRIALDGGATFSVDTSVDVIVTDAADVVEAAFVEGSPNCATATLTAFTGATPTVALSAGAADGVRTVTGCFADRAGNRSQASDTIIVDRVDPAGSVVVASGAAFVRGVAGRAADPVDVNVEVNGASADVTAVAVGIPDVNCATATYQPFVPLLRVSLNVEGNTTVAACLKDGAGRTAKFTDTVVLDRIAPNGTVVLNGGAGSVTSILVNAQFTADADVVAAALVGGDADCETLSAGLFTAVPPLTRQVTLLGAGPQIATACFRDAADNRRRATDTIDVDLSSLDQVEVIAANGADFSRTANVTLNVLAPVDAQTSKIVVDASNLDTNGNNIVDVCEAGVFTAFNATPTVTSLAEGARTIGVCVRTPTRTLYAEDNITVDTVVPTGTLVIAGNAARTKNELVLVDLTFAADVDSIAVTNAASIDCANASFEPAIATKTVALPGPDNEAANTIRACLRDRAGNTAVVSDSIIFDRLPPQGVAVALVDLTSTPAPNAGFLHATSATARLTLGTGTTQVAVGEGLVDCDAATFQNASGATVDVAVGVSAGDNSPKTVGACFKDAIGNVVALAATSVLDTSVPVGRAIVANGADTTTSRTVSVALDAPSDVHLASIVEAATLNCATATYQALVANGSFTLTGAEGLRTLSVCFKDDSGRTALTNDTITLDLTRPTGTLALVGNGQAGFTNTTQIAANIASVDADEMAIATSSIDCDNVAYAAFATTATLTLPSGDGSKSVFLCLRDRAGNKSLLITSSITLDQTPPAAAAHTVSINSAAAFSTTTSTSLSVAFAADAVERAIANDGLDCSSATYTTLPATSPQTVAGHVLSAGDGVKLVSVCFRDRARNTTLATDTIVLDTVAPSTLDTTLAINAGAARTSSTTLALTLSVPSDVDGVAYQEGALSQAACDAQVSFEAPTSPRAFVLASSTEGTKTVSACVRESAGRRIVVADTVFLDPNRPTLTAVTLDGASSGGATRDRVVDVVVVGASADTVAMAVADADIADCAAASYVPFVGAFSRSLVAGDGIKTVSVCLKDETGNVSASSIEATINLDTSAPTGATVDAPATTTSPTINVTLAYASTGVGLATAAAVAEGAIDCSTATRLPLDGASPDSRALTLAGADGARSIVACFYDDAGNFTAAAADSVVLDTRAPVVSAVSCTNCTADGATLFSTSTTVTLAASSDESGSGVSGNALVSVDGVEASRAFASGVVNVAGLAAGAHTLRVRLIDNAGNTTAIADAKTVVVTVDNVAPALASNADFKVNGQNSGTFTSSSSVAITINNPPADATQMAIAEGALTCATAQYVPLVTSFSFNLTGAAQTLRPLQLCLKDRAGNVSTTAQTASTTFDTAPPSLATTAVVIDNADADNNHNAFLTSTAGLRILLDWTTAGDVTAFKVSEGFADCTEPMERPVNIATIDAFAKTDFVLSSVDGNKIVFACFKDAAGNTSTSSNSSVLDQVGANGAVSVNAGAAFTTNVAEDVSVTLRMGDDTARFALQETANATCTTPTLNCATASFVAVSGATIIDGALQQTVTQNLSGAAAAAQGAKCFEACFEDAAGNRTATASLDGITFDTVAPTGSASLTGLSLTAGLTRSPFVTLTISGAPADTTTMRASEDSGFVGGTVAFDAFTATRSIALTPNDGSKQVNVQLKDAAGNVSSLAINASIVLDTTPPTGTAVVINNGATATSSSTVSVFAQATGATERLVLTPDNPADAEAFAAFPISPATLSGVVVENGVTAGDDGQKTVLVVFRDAAGNEASAAFDTIELDRVAPTPSTLTCGAGTATGLCLNNGATATNSVVASLTLAASGATEMSVATDGCADNEADEPFVTFSTAIQALLDGSTQGTKTVAVRFRDAAGNVSQAFTNCATTPGHVKSIDFDTVAPSGVLVSLTSTAAGDPAGFTTTALANGTFTRGDATSFKHGQAVDCGTAAGYAAISGVSTTVNNIALGGGNGLKPYFSCFKDDAGNVTSATTSITVDNQVPVGTLVLADGAATIGASATTATLTFSNDTTGVLVQSASLATCPTSAAAYVPAQASLALTLTSGSGTRSGFACLRDSAGNVSSVLTDDVVVDVTPPTLSITVNGSATSPLTTNSTTVTLGVTAADANGPVTMAISNTPLTCATANYTTLSASVQHQIPVSASTTINVCARDGLGVTTASPATFLVNLDQTGPTATFELQKVAGTSTELTNSLTANVRVNTAEAGVTRKVVNDFADCSGSGFVALATGVQDIAHTLSAGEGTKTVFVCLKDSVGNITIASDTIVLDTVAPSGATFALENGAAFSTDTTVTGNFTNIADVAQMRFFATDPGACPTPFTGYAAFTSGSNVTTVTFAQGTNTVFACLADAAGNTLKVSDSVDVDTTDPTVTFSVLRRGLPAPDPTFTNTREVTLSVTAGSVAAGSSIAIANTALTCAAATTSFTPLPNPLPALPFNIDTDLASGGVDDLRTVTVCIREPSGRTNGASGTSASINLDTTPPSVAVSINAGASITATDVVTLAFTPSPANDALRFFVSRVPTEDCAAGAYSGAFGTVTGQGSFTLDNGAGADDSGTKFAVGCFQDRAGNTAAGVDDIFFDEERPAFGSNRPVCADCNLVDATAADTFGDEVLGFFNSASPTNVLFDLQFTSSDVVNVLTLATTDTDQTQVNGLGEDRVCTVDANCSTALGETCRNFPAKDSPQVLLKRCVFVSPADAVAAVPLAGEGRKSMVFSLEDAAGNLSNGRNLFVVRDTVAPTATFTLAGISANTAAISRIDDTGVGGTVVISTVGNHSFAVGDAITVAGVNGGGATYDGNYTVAVIEAPDRIRTNELDPGGAAENDVQRATGTATFTITANQSVFVRDLTVTGETAQLGALRIGRFRASAIANLSDAATLDFNDVVSPFVLTDAIPVTLTAGDGAKTIFVEFADNAGNTATVTQSTTLDATSPSDPQWANSTTLIDGATSVSVLPLAVASTDDHLLQPRPYTITGFANTTGIADTDVACVVSPATCTWNGTGAFTVAASNLAEGENRLRVSAVDVANNTGNVDFFIITRDSVKPPAPTNLRKAERSTAVTFTWDRSTSTDVDGYLIHYGSTPQFDGGNFADQGPSPLFVRQPPAGAPQVDFTLTGLVDNSPLSVSITSVDLVGNESATALTGTALPNPVAPVQLTIGATAPATGTTGDDVMQVVGPRLYLVEPVDAVTSRLCVFDTASGSMSRLGCSNGAPVAIANARLTVHGRFAYLANQNQNRGDNLRVFDVGNPASITGPTTLDIMNDGAATAGVTNIDDTGAGGTVVVNFGTAHGLVVGDSIEISGADSGTIDYNGFYTVAQVISTTSIRTLEVDPGADNDTAATAGTVRTHDAILDFVIPGRFAVGLRKTATASGSPSLESQAFTTPLATNASNTFVPLGTTVAESTGNFTSLLAFDTDGQRIAMLFNTSTETAVLRTRGFSNPNGPPQTNNPLTSSLSATVLADSHDTTIVASNGVLFGAGTAGLHVYVLSANNTVLSQIGARAGFDCDAIDVAGGFVYCNDTSLGSASRLFVINVTNGFVPRLAGRALIGTNAGSIRALRQSDGHLYAVSDTTSGTRQIEDIELTSAARLNSTAAVGQTMRDVAGFRNTIYGAEDGGRVCTIGVINPEDPAVLACGASGGGGFANDGSVAISGYTVVEHDFGDVAEAFRVHDPFTGDTVAIAPIPASGICSGVGGSALTFAVATYGNLVITLQSNGKLQSWDLTRRQTISTVDTPTITCISELDMGADNNGLVDLSNVIDGRVLVADDDDDSDGDGEVYAVNISAAGTLTRPATSAPLVVQKGQSTALPFISDVRFNGSHAWVTRPATTSANLDGQIVRFNIANGGAFSGAVTQTKPAGGIASFGTTIIAGVGAVDGGNQVGRVEGIQVINAANTKVVSQSAGLRTMSRGVVLGPVLWTASTAGAESAFLTR